MCRVGEDEAVSKVQMIDKTERIIVKSHMLHTSR